MTADSHQNIERSRRRGEPLHSNQYLLDDGLATPEVLQQRIEIVLRDEGAVELLSTHGVREGIVGNAARRPWEESPHPADRRALGAPPDPSMGGLEVRLAEVRERRGR